jgi:hypothetical protein
MLTLSPGERAGVRAGVITNFMPASKEFVSNLLFR